MTVPPDVPKPVPRSRKGRTPRSGKRPADSPETLELQRKFGADLKAARLAIDLTQAQLARLVGAPESTISVVESGKRNLTIDVMRRLAVAVGCSLILHLNPDGAPQSARLERDSSVKS